MSQIKNAAIRPLASESAPSGRIEPARCFDPTAVVAKGIRKNITLPGLLAAAGSVPAPCRFHRRSYCLRFPEPRGTYDQPSDDGDTQESPGWRGRRAGTRSKIKERLRKPFAPILATLARLSNWLPIASGRAAAAVLKENSFLLPPRLRAD